MASSYLDPNNSRMLKQCFSEKWLALKWGRGATGEETNTNILFRIKISENN